MTQRTVLADISILIQSRSDGGRMDTSMESQSATNGSKTSLYRSRKANSKMDSIWEKNRKSR